MERSPFVSRCVGRVAARVNTCASPSPLSRTLRGPTPEDDSSLRFIKFSFLADP